MAAEGPNLHALGLLDSNKGGGSNANADPLGNEDLGKNIEKGVDGLPDKLAKLLSMIPIFGSFLSSIVPVGTNEGGWIQGTAGFLAGKINPGAATLTAKGGAISAATLGTLSKNSAITNLAADVGGSNSGSGDGGGGGGDYSSGGGGGSSHIDMSGGHHFDAIAISPLPVGESRFDWISITAMPEGGFRPMDTGSGMGRSGGMEV